MRKKTTILFVPPSFGRSDLERFVCQTWLLCRPVVHSLRGEEGRGGGDQDGEGVEDERELGISAIRRQTLRRRRVDRRQTELKHEEILGPEPHSLIAS